MSLPAGQQRILDGIAETLRLTEPRLTVMFAIFTRLASSEPPPCREQIPARRRSALLAAPRRPLLAWRTGHRGLAWRRLLIISQVAIAVVALLVLTLVTTHGAAGCDDLQRPHADASYAPRWPACLAPGSSGFRMASK
jgi:hypothetical protein